MTVTIEGYDNHSAIQWKIRIGNVVTATTLPDGETVLIRIFEANLIGEKEITLLYTLQLRRCFAGTGDRPILHGVK